MGVNVDWDVKVGKRRHDERSERTKDSAIGSIVRTLWSKELNVGFCDAST